MFIIMFRNRKTKQSPSVMVSETAKQKQQGTVPETYIYKEEQKWIISN